MRVQRTRELGSRPVNDGVHLDDLGADRGHRPLDQRAVEREQRHVLLFHARERTAGREQKGVRPRHPLAQVAVVAPRHDAGPHDVLRRRHDILAIALEIRHHHLLSQLPA